MIKKIAIATTIHPRFDTRVWVKEAAALSELDDVEVIEAVMDGEGDFVCDKTGITIKDIGLRPAGKIKRMSVGCWRMYRFLRSEKVDVVHLHDPEMIWAGLLLKMTGHVVVYDAHEDLPNQVRNKSWIPVYIAGLVSAFARFVLWLVGLFFDGVITATDPISDTFPARKTICVKNYPMLSEIRPDNPTPYAERSKNLLYVGSLTHTRGCLDIINAMHYVQDQDAVLQIAGSMNDAKLGAAIEASPGISRVVMHGFASRAQVAKHLDEAMIGLVVLHPTPSYVVSLPVKMFEYMAAGIPVVASNFALFKEIVESADCGILVEPEDPEGIAKAIDTILGNPERARIMGENGLKAVQSHYSWEQEKLPFQDFYRSRLLS